jgi:hypothetical protein
VWRLCTNDTNHIAAAGLNPHPLTQQHLIPPTAQLQKVDVAALVNVAHHKADFIHMTGQHDTRGICLTLHSANHTAKVVACQVAQRGKHIFDNRTDFSFVARYTIGLGEKFE